MSNCANLRFTVGWEGRGPPLTGKRHVGGLVTKRHVVSAVASTALFLGMASPAAAHLETPAGDFGGMEPDTLPSGNVIEDIGDPSAPTREGFGLGRAEQNPTPIDCTEAITNNNRFCSVLDGGPPHE